MPITTTAVELAYRLILGREPENNDVLLAHAASCHSLADLRRALLSSREFRSRFVDIQPKGNELEVVSGIQFQLDEPAIRDGVVTSAISGVLRLVGWALTTEGIAGIDVSIDGKLLGSAHYGISRPDVGIVNPTIPGAARSGFNFIVPERMLGAGEHTVAIVARSSNGRKITHSFRVIAKQAVIANRTNSICQHISPAEIDVLADVLTQSGWIPPFELVIIDRGSMTESVRQQTILSILEQTCQDWRGTILVPDQDTADHVCAVIAQVGHARSARLRVTLAEHAVGQALAMDFAKSSLVGFMFMGDVLGHDALGAFAVESILHPAADVFYADEVRVDTGCSASRPYYKPDYSPTLLLSANYVGRPLVVRPPVFSELAQTINELMRNGMYDYVLRSAEVAKSIRHIPMLLSRTDQGCTTLEDDGAEALVNALKRRAITADVFAGAISGTWRVRRRASVTGKVSIIVPTCASRGLVETCLNSLREKTAYRNYEIICVENIPAGQEQWREFVTRHADKVLPMPDHFNWSRFNNLAVDVADGEYLLFLNDDVEIIESDWLEAMLEDAVRPEVGIVGARLLYPDRSVQHAGMFLVANGGARHAFRYLESTDPGYFGLALSRREVMAVTGACLMIRRDVFERLGRFDEAHRVIRNDLDLCLRAHRAGLLTIYTPYATLIHHERASRENSPEDFDAARFDAEWRTLFAGGDPYYNPRLSQSADDYRVEEEETRAHYMVYPVMRHAEVKRILVMKLDHIGDFLAALPAIRRLKQIFPDARITLLAAPASRSLIHLEPAIEEFIPLEFFHARSQLGERSLTPEDLAQLTAQLNPYHFDLAIDLRKHLSTRPLLQCSGARVLAGYDAAGQYPWLNIAVEFDEDRALRHKRCHITGSLRLLVDAVAAAFEYEPLLMDMPNPLAVTDMPERIRHLFERPVVAVHAGAGNVNKQWPSTHFVNLIQLLIERNGVSVLLVGGKDEGELVQSIVDQLAQPERVASIAGELSLQDLPQLMTACALFIGNDSGPKHIAAAIGVPTIGIHSGVTSPIEWGPLGRRAVAMSRNMTCAPCYLDRVEDCPRQLACLRLLEPALVHRQAEMFLAQPLNMQKLP